MKKIEDYADLIDEEIADADKYAKKALVCKDLDPDAAQTFFQLSIEELNHSDRLHKLAVAAIKKLQAEGVEPPEPWMLREYERRHSKAIDATKEVRLMQEMYRGA